MLYLLLATLVFLQMAACRAWWRRSFELSHPAGRGWPGPSLGAPGRVVVVAASAKLDRLGLALAAPVVVALWLTDLALGLVARAAPQVPVYFLGLPLKGLLAIGVVLLGLGALQGALARGFADWFRLLAQAVAGFR